MQVEIDPDVQAVTEFMQRNIPCDRLVGVAQGVHALAPILWGQYTPTAIRPLALGVLQATASETSRLAATGSAPLAACADGDSVAAADGL